MSTTPITCPRRMSEYGPWEHKEGLDSYEGRGGLIGQPRGCSFCGSLPPDDFMEHVRAGRPLGPTDKSYKLYVHEIPRDGDPADLRVISSSTHASSRLKAWSDLSRAEKNAVKAQSTFPTNRKEGFYGFAPWGETVEGKFYTVHLSLEQGHEFWDLHLAGKVTWSYPLYRPLYIPGPSNEATR